MDESVLIVKAEEFLDEIEEDKISLENIEDFEVFKNLYFKLINRLDTLQKMREEMDLQGYTSPFRAIHNFNMNTVSDVSSDELGENSHHNKYFRMRAIAKKNILDRVKSAIDAHLISIGNLEQYGYVKCDSCYKKYRMDEFKDKCSCGCENFSFKINKQESYRLEIIPYLPLSGNYMVLRNHLSSWGRDSFKKVLNFLKQEKQGTVKTVSLVIKFKDENGRQSRKKIHLDSEFLDCYEEEARRLYGPSVRIEAIKFHRTKPAIIDDKHARTALALAYVQYSEDLINDISDSILKRKISDFKRLKKYDEINEKYANITPKYLEDNQEIIDEWRQSKINEDLKKLGYVDKYGNYNRSLVRDLKTRENIENIIFKNLATTLISWDIFRYYLTTSFNRRKITRGPFPYIRVELDRQQRSIFQKTYHKVISVLNKQTDIKIIPVKDMDLVLYEKFKLEKLIRSSNMKFNYPSLGAALIHLNSGIELDVIGNAFNVNESKIKKEISNINKLKKPKSSKSKEFLKLIKK